MNKLRSPERSAIRAKAWICAERYGCCGRTEHQYSIDVEDYDERGVMFNSFTIVKCRLIGGRECIAAKMNDVISLYSIINGDSSDVEARRPRPFATV